MKPELVDGDGPFVLEGVRPFAAVFVLLVLPFGSNALFEKMVIGFEAEFGGRSDVILVVGKSAIHTLPLNCFFFAIVDPQK